MFKRNLHLLFLPSYLHLRINVIVYSAFIRINLYCKHEEKEREQLQSWSSPPVATSSVGTVFDNTLSYKKAQTTWKALCPLVKVHPMETPLDNQCNKRGQERTVTYCALTVITLSRRSKSRGVAEQELYKISVLVIVHNLELWKMWSCLKPIFTSSSCSPLPNPFHIPFVRLPSFRKGFPESIVRGEGRTGQLSECVHRSTQLYTLKPPVEKAFKKFPKWKWSEPIEHAISPKACKAHPKEKLLLFIPFLLIHFTEPSQ